MNALRRVTLVAESSSQALHPEERPSVKPDSSGARCVAPQAMPHRPTYLHR